MTISLDAAEPKPAHAGPPEEVMPPGEPPAEVSREEMMLAYVAVTRARGVLDRGGLAWVDDYTGPVSSAADNIAAKANTSTVDDPARVPVLIERGARYVYLADDGSYRLDPAERVA